MNRVTLALVRARARRGVVAAGLFALAAAGCTTPRGNTTPAAAKDRDLVLTGKNAEAVALVRQGLDMVDNARRPDAVALAKKALALEPDLPCALALETYGTPGDDGDAFLAKATAAPGLPEAERVWMGIVEADHRADFASGLSRARRLVELLPDAARAWFLLGAMNDELSRYPDATAALEKAIALDPAYAAPLNRLAYVELALKKTDGAIGHLKRYAELRPGDPNPNDSLGEALLGAGRLEEAESAFERSTQIDPSFAWAWEGIAFAKVLQGDAKGGLAAFEKSLDAATPEQKPDVIGRDRVLVQIALGRTADAKAALKQLESDAKKAGSDSNLLSAPVFLALAELEAGDGKTALQALEDSRPAIEKSDLPGVQRAILLAMHARVAAYTARRLANTIGAGRAKTIAAGAATTAATAANGRTGVPALASALAFTTGERAFIEHRYEDAATRFGSCAALDDLCKMELAEALDAAGQPARARPLREELLAASKRDGWSFFARTKASAALELHKSRP